MQAERPGGADGDTTVLLIRRIKRGDREAEEELCRRFQPRLERWARGRLPRASRGVLDTQDLVQDVLTRSLIRVPDLNARRSGGFQAYLYRAMRNRLRDERRALARRPRRDGTVSDIVDGSRSPLESLLTRDSMERYERAMARLPDRDQALIFSRLELHMTFAEIATDLGRPSPDAARVAFNRALEKLVEKIALE